MRNQGKIWAARLIALIIAAVLCLLACRLWLKSVLGCAGAIDYATYEDEDELSRTPVSVPFETRPILDDSAYDRVFPDLIEPSIDG